ncbi:hypothetical protein OAO65_02165 [Flavobacteriales bacterium]|nr:hypothetical protein [Flavobacteriales bacterium]
MIETTLERIADALEAISSKMNVPSKPAPKVKTVKKQEAAPVVEAPTPSVPPASAGAASSPAPVVTPPPAPVVTPPPVVEPVVVMTPEELNAAVLVEFNRLGTQDGIRAVMAEMGVSGLTDLNPDQYAELLAKVRAL